MTFREFTDVETGRLVSINLSKVTSFTGTFYRKSPEIELYPTSVKFEGAGQSILIDTTYAEFKLLMEESDV